MNTDNIRKEILEAFNCLERSIGFFGESLESRRLITKMNKAKFSAIAGLEELNKEIDENRNKLKNIEQEVGRVLSGFEGLQNPENVREQIANAVQAFLKLKMDVVHDLKCHPKPFEDLLSGNKTFEFRKNDRNFNVGDILILQEWDPETEDHYTGRNVRRRIKHILSEGYGLPEGFCILSLADDHEQLNEEQFSEIAEDLYFTGSPEDYHTPEDRGAVESLNIERRKAFLNAFRQIKRMGYQIIRQKSTTH